jgi:hypothetical protein
MFIVKIHAGAIQMAGSFMLIICLEIKENYLYENVNIAETNAVYLKNDGL